MVTATITTKGQVTIPKIVRETLHLRSGDRIAFYIHDGDRATLKPLNKTVDEVFGCLHDPARKPLTVEEMKAAVAGKMRNRKR